MIDPTAPAVDVSWQGKTYTVQLTLGALCGASRRLGIPTLEGGPGCMDDLPEMPRRAVVIFAALHRKLPSITLEQVEDAILQPSKFAHYRDVHAELMQGVAAQVEEIRKATTQPPLDETGSGGASGLPESSTSD